MKKLLILFHTNGLLMAMIAGVVTMMAAGCTPEKGPGLGAPIKPTFTISGGGSNNTVTAVNTTHSVIAYWTAPGFAQQDGDTGVFKFVFQGTYPITLVVISQGGLDTLTQTVTINQNDPTACTTSMQGFIAGCSQKTWKLNPDAAAEAIGPSAGSTAWWASGAAEPTGDRICDFNDTYTFSFNQAGTFVYDNQGDYYTENYLGNSNNDCDVNANLSAATKPWASGNFTYQFIPGGGAAKMGQLKVIGLGAHIGLPRVMNGADASSDLPAQSVTYDIIDTAHNAAGGYDLLTLTIQGNPGDWWTWTLRSF